jgi:proteasome accessory factor B
MKKGKPAGRYTQAGRLHDIIRTIEARHGVTIEELAEEAGVSRRTLHRDLAAIQEAGYPLVSEWEEGRKLYRFLTRFRDVPPITFSLPELLTLSYLRSQTGFLAGTPFARDMDAIFRKVNSVLPPRYAAHLERAARVTLPLLQGRRDYTRLSAELETIREALLYQYRLRLTYRPQGAGEGQEYLLDPYTLAFYKGGLYLIGYAHNRRALRTFALERLAAVELLKERFEVREDLSPEEHLKGAFGIVEEEALEVVVRFSPEMVPAVEGRLWHPTQTQERQKDGSLLLSFRAGGRREIISWVLSYGPGAEVVAPASLRGEVAAAARAMGRLYGPGGEEATGAPGVDKSPSHAL